MYISVHYHYRSDSHRIEKSKELITALCKLYDASIYLDPIYTERFQEQDITIRTAVLAGGARRNDALKFFQKIGGVSHKILAAFGNMVGSKSASHWFKVDSSYATIEYALESPKGAAALAQRIWISLTAQGRDVLTAEDIAEAFGPHRKEDAQKYFEILDQNENGDIRLDELVPTLVEAGRQRNNIYQGMSDINHAINTFEWILLLIIGLAMVAFISKYP